MKHSLKIFAFILAATHPVVAEIDDLGPYRVKREFRQFTPMRDGILLATDVYRPERADKISAILLHTPYTRTLETYFLQGQYWASHGYAFVVQDVRGRGDSEGAFTPLAQETNDGFDAQSWIAQQSWSNGQVGTIGRSYSGWTQVLPASLNNPALKAMIPVVTPPDPGKYWPMRNGGLSIGMLEWAMLVDGRTIHNFPQSAVKPETGAVVWEAYNSLPLRDIDTNIGYHSRIWQDYLDNLYNESYWVSHSYQHRLHKSQTPMLHVTGWYDGTLGGSLQNFPNMRQNANPKTRDEQYLIIGPWRHWVESDAKNAKIGDIEFGYASRIDLLEIYRKWFDYHIGGMKNEVEDWPHVRLFVMNGNRWIEADDWPVPGTEYTNFYLREGNKLEKAKPITNEGPDTYTYDPANAAPFIWSYSVDSGGPDNYKEVDERSDVLVYETGVSEDTFTVCGPITATVYAATSANDTDWVARISLVHPSGYVQRLTEGWVRARFRNGLFKNELVQPGIVEQYKIDLWGTAVEVRPGYALRLSITSSTFPLLARNLNTGGDITNETNPVVASQTIYHNTIYSSYVTLPILAK
jgi:hypothetical protein